MRQWVQPRSSTAGNPRSRRAAPRVALLLLASLLLMPPLGLSLAYGEPEQWDADYGRERVFDAVVAVFERNYWDPGYLDWDEWSAPYREDAIAADSREAFDRVLDRMVGSLHDDHSAWLGLVRFDPPEDGAPSVGPPRLGFRASLLNGTGLVVERVFAGTAAERAGLRRGDVIRQAEEFDLTEPGAARHVWSVLRQVSDRPSVTLRILRGRSAVTVVVTPAPFELTIAEQLPQAEMLDDRLGYLYVPSFNRPDIGAEVHDLLRGLQGQGLSELVVDLRGNPGGRIGELGLTLGAFIDGTWARAISRGEVVWQGRYSQEERRGLAWLEDSAGRVLLTRRLERPTQFSGPMAVLVNRHNSSAGEVAALALQARGRALVVGEPTFGNVEAIRGFDLPDGSVVMVAVANLEAPDGSSFSEGVTPDHIASDSLRELAAGYDAPLAEAIRLLRGLPFTPNRYFGSGAAF